MSTDPPLLVVIAVFGRVVYGKWFAWRVWTLILARIRAVLAWINTSRPKVQCSCAGIFLFWFLSKFNRGLGVAGFLQLLGNSLFMMRFLFTQGVSFANIHIGTAASAARKPLLSTKSCPLSRSSFSNPHDRQESNGPGLANFAAASEEKQRC